MMSVMKESVIYQDILVRGERRGRTEEARSIVIRLLTKRFTVLPITSGASEAIELQANINELEVEQIESLGDALLDFTSIDDLLAWFDGV